MADITVSRRLRVEAVASAGHSRGPSLVGESHAQVVASVSDVDGNPLQHLTADAFRLEEMFSTNNAYTPADISPNPYTGAM